MRLWLLQLEERNAALSFMKDRGLMDTAFESTHERGLQDVAFKLEKGRGVQNAAFKKGRGLQDATSKASHAILIKDFVGSFNAKSALTVGDLCPWCLPE